MARDGLSQHKAEAARAEVKRLVLASGDNDVLHARGGQPRAHTIP
jgi:hypothetical protein